jgi:hypothetical protein
LNYGKTEKPRIRANIYFNEFKKSECMEIRNIFIISLLLISLNVEAESIRVIVAGQLETSHDKGDGPIPMHYNTSCLLSLTGDSRFMRGIEVELSAPQRWPANQGSLAMALYSNLDRIPAIGVADLEGRQIAFEPLPGKIQIVYQIPIRPSSGMRSSPYAAVIGNTALPSSLPLLLRIMPVIKGISDELEKMIFQVSVRPILSDEGLIKFRFRYPEQLKGKPFTVLVDDALIPDPFGELLLKQGEHHLAILSEDYRNESRRFAVERAKTLELNIALQDPTPIVIFEAPQNTRIFLDNAPVSPGKEPVPVEPGPHEVKIHLGDYTITKTFIAQRGKTYTIPLAVDINVIEE